MIVETPDLETFQEAMASDAAANAMNAYGVRPETVLMLVEG